MKIIDLNQIKTGSLLYQKGSGYYFVTHIKKLNDDELLLDLISKSLIFYKKIIITSQNQWLKHIV